MIINKIFINLKMNDKEIKQVFRISNIEYPYILDKIIEEIKSFPNNIKQSLYEYTTDDFYEELKERLTQNKNNEFGDKVEQIDKDLNYTFENVSPIENDLIVYRGIKDIKSLNTKGYFSCSLDRKVAESFMEDRGYLLIIKILRGSRILPLFVLAETISEFEVLLNKTGKFITGNGYNESDKILHVIYEEY